MVQSELAEEVWQNVAELADHVSRIDLCVTAWTEKREEGLAVEGFDKVDELCRLRGRKARRGLIKDGLGGETLYIGARESDYFGRLYDKSRQTTDPKYAKAWRYEVEVKGRSSDPLARALVGADDRAGAIVGTVYDYFLQRGVRPIFARSGYSLRDGLKLDKPNDVSRLNWLETSVGPTVRELAGKYGLLTIIQALGLPPELVYNPTNRTNQTYWRVGEWQSLPVTASAPRSSELTTGKK